jgi:predicted transposase YbfD/YdcC
VGNALTTVAQRSSSSVVENGLHWVLDISFDEDAARIHKDYVNRYNTTTG